MLLVYIRIYLKSDLRYRFLILETYIYVSKDVRFLGYFSKLKGVREQNKFAKH
jgi:hypothetical protein